MIYTLTANPAIDYNITCDALAPDAVTRTRDAVYTPNGKGLNVSFTLAHYGVASTILGFFAGFSGRYIVDGARALGCAVEPVWIDGVTRVNVFLTSNSGEYKLVNAGAPVTAVDEARMLELIGGPSRAAPPWRSIHLAHARQRGSVFWRWRAALVCARQDARAGSLHGVRGRCLARCVPCAVASRRGP